MANQRRYLGLGRDGLALLLFIGGLIPLVPVALALFEEGGIPVGKGPTAALAKEIMEGVGTLPPLFLGGLISVLGAWMFVSPRRLEIHRHLAAITGLFVGLILLLGAAESAWGGDVMNGGYVGLRLAGAIGVYLAAFLGVAFAALPVWVFWLHGFVSLGDMPKIPRLFSPPAAESTEGLQNGVSIDEAAELVPDDETLAYMEQVWKSGQQEAAPIQAPIPPPVPLYPEDVRLKGEVPTGTVPLEPSDAEPQPQRTPEFPTQSGGASEAVGSSYVSLGSHLAAEVGAADQLESSERAAAESSAGQHSAGAGADDPFSGSAETELVAPLSGEPVAAAETELSASTEDDSLAGNASIRDLDESHGAHSAAPQIDTERDGTSPLDDNAGPPLPTWEEPRDLFEGSGATAKDPFAAPKPSAAPEPQPARSNSTWVRAEQPDLQSSAEPATDPVIDEVEVESAETMEPVVDSIVAEPSEPAAEEEELLEESAEESGDDEEWEEEEEEEEEEWDEEEWEEGSSEEQEEDLEEASSDSEEGAEVAEEAEELEEEWAEDEEEDDEAEADEADGEDEDEDEEDEWEESAEFEDEAESSESSDELDVEESDTETVNDEIEAPSSSETSQSAAPLEVAAEFSAVLESSESPTADPAVHEPIAAEEDIEEEAEELVADLLDAQEDAELEQEEEPEAAESLFAEEESELEADMAFDLEDAPDEEVEEPFSTPTFDFDGNSAEVAEAPVAEDSAETVTEVALISEEPAAEPVAGEDSPSDVSKSADSTPAEAPAAEAEDAAEELEGAALIQACGRLFLERGRVAVSLLQRNFGLEFDEACAVLDELQEVGMIGPYLGGQRRDILLTSEEWEILGPKA